jgi:glycosyltransferase involved in cell wall biosynthesis
MHILYVVQRYGEEIAGGSEQHTRAFAERMVTRGHRVEVLTTTAASYVDWANEFPPGFSRCNEVGVRRVQVGQPRNGALFGDLNARMVLSRYSRPLSIQREWMRMQGPDAPGIVPFLRRRARDYDVVIFITYLYWTAWAGLRACAGSVPTILHPTAHDEPPLRMSIFDEVLRLPDALAFLTPEEQQIVDARFPGAPRGDVIGIGIDTSRPGRPERFRARFGLGDAPYLLYVGRVDPAKGAAELLDYFDHYKRRNPGPLRLVLLGEQVVEFERRSDVVVTDFVDGTTRDDALAGTLALVQPSYFESFSLVLNEAFAQGRPALVQGRCTVLAGHAHRSGAAIPYSGFAEFEAALDLLLERPGLADEMGEAGRQYVTRDYQWETVLDRYEQLLERVTNVRRPVQGREQLRTARRRNGSDATPASAPRSTD